ncbi:ATP-binding protein [Streptomyces sp. NPDC088812]|uniref:HAMP domain-containing sensor histidine kinase n=1 Tax=Streptomyces sp. NPDC088812 TaxID=3365905 RepID=UPI00382457C7
MSLLSARLTRRIVRPRLPRRSLRLRLTLVYSGLFLLSGAALLTVTWFLLGDAISGSLAKDIIPAPGSPTAEASAHPPPGTPPGGQRQVKVLSEQQRQTLLRQKSAVMDQLVVQSCTALGLMLVLSIVLGWVVAGRILRPVRMITSAAREISATNLHRRLDLDGPADELKELGDTFDSLLGRLEASFQAQRRFVANASHELRTPLARQRTLGQVALGDPNATVDSLRSAHQRILAGGVQQERLIEALLTLARSQGGIDVREPLDLTRLAGEAVDPRRAEARDRQVTFHLATGPALALGHRSLAERLVVNLVDNALRYNVPGGRVEVATGTDGDKATITVSNTGPAVPQEEVERLFQPFQRLEDTRAARREGLGLGLSIVRAVAEAHDAAIDTRVRAGGGLRVTVAFPAAAHSTGTRSA